MKFVANDRVLLTRAASLLALAAMLASGAALAHTDPPGATQTGIAGQLGVFSDATCTTMVTPPIEPNQMVWVRATLQWGTGNRASYEAGGWRMQASGTVIDDDIGTVPCIGQVGVSQDDPNSAANAGRGICAPTTGSVTSECVGYSPTPADVAAGGITFEAVYGDPNPGSTATAWAHIGVNDRAGVSASIPQFVAIRRAPAITIEKATNGEDADTPTGPQIPVGGTVTWTYNVRNTGNVPLTNVAVTDDKGVTITCPGGNPIPTLQVGDNEICTATGTAQAGQYANIGTATGQYTPTSETVTDTDPSHYFGPQPAIDIEKATNGVDADLPDQGPQLGEGNAVTWTYVVTNTGNVALTNVRVTDDRIGAITCPATTLAVGASMTCTATGTAQSPNAVPNPYANNATATGQPPTGSEVTDTDPSHYISVPTLGEVARFILALLLIGGPAVFLSLRQT